MSMLLLLLRKRSELFFRNQLSRNKVLFCVSLPCRKPPVVNEAKACHIACENFSLLERVAQLRHTSKILLGLAFADFVQRGSTRLSEVLPALSSLPTA